MTDNLLLLFSLYFLSFSPPLILLAEILSRYGKTYDFELKAKLMGLREKEVNERKKRKDDKPQGPPGFSVLFSLF